MPSPTLVKKGKYYIRTMQMDLKAAESGELPKEKTKPEVSMPKLKPAAPKIESIRPKPQPPAAAKPFSPPGKKEIPIHPVSKIPPPNLPISQKPTPPTEIKKPQPPITAPQPKPEIKKPQKKEGVKKFLRLPGMPVEGLPKSPKPVDLSKKPEKPKLDLKVSTKPYARELPKEIKKEKKQKIKQPKRLKLILVITSVVILLGAGGYVAYNRRLLQHLYRVIHQNQLISRVAETVIYLP
jgi:hypothetical protein